MQQIAYLMSAVANQTNLNLTKTSGHTGFKPNGNICIPPIHFIDLNMIERTSLAGDVGEQDIAGENVPLPDKGIISLLDPILQLQIQELDQI